MTNSDRESDDTARMLAALSDAATISALQKRQFLTYLIKLAMVEMINPLAGAIPSNSEERRHFQS